MLWQKSKYHTIKKGWNGFNTRDRYWKPTTNTMIQQKYRPQRVFTVVVFYLKTLKRVIVVCQWKGNNWTTLLLFQYYYYTSTLFYNVWIPSHEQEFKNLWYIQLIKCYQCKWKLKKPSGETNEYRNRSAKSGASNWKNIVN